MAQLPIAIGLVLCEQVIIEEGTRNITPVNCFNVREVDDIPGRASFCVLAWLADGKGEKTAELVVQRLDNLDEVFSYLPLNFSATCREDFGFTRRRVRARFDHSASPPD